MEEQIWVSTSEGAEITGYFQTHVQKLARDNWALPESERRIKVRKRSRGYDIWLPDLIKHLETKGNGPQVHNRKNESPDTIAVESLLISEQVEAIWVNTSEGAEITGYYPTYVQKLARDNWNLPEEQRTIKVRKRANRYDIWLPDLLNYLETQGLGPYNRSDT